MMEYTMQEKYALIKRALRKEKGTDPLAIAENVMKNDFVSMHGPEHHFLDGACFLTAIYNANPFFDLETSLDELSERSIRMPGRCADIGKSAVQPPPSVQPCRCSLWVQSGPRSFESIVKSDSSLTLSSTAVPYGFKRTGKYMWEADEEEAKKVHYLFDMGRNTDMTVDGFVELLRRKGVFGGDGESFKSKTVYCMLSNRRYVGGYH